MVAYFLKLSSFTCKFVALTKRSVKFFNFSDGTAGAVERKLIVTKFPTGCKFTNIT